jgi:hypothetical protein
MMTVCRNVHKFLYSIIKILEKSETKKVRRFVYSNINIFILHLNRHLHIDLGIRIVIADLKVFKCEIFDVVNFTLKV